MQSHPSYACTPKSHHHRRYPLGHALMHICMLVRTGIAQQLLVLSQCNNSLSLKKKKATSKGCDLGYLDLLYQTIQEGKSRRECDTGYPDSLDQKVSVVIFFFDGGSSTQYQLLASGRKIKTPSMHMRCKAQCYRDADGWSTM